MRLFTYTLSSGSITISATDGVTQITLQANATSSATILGNIPFKNLSPNPVSLNDGQALTITTPTYAPLDGVTISWVSGSIDIVIGF